MKKKDTPKKCVKKKWWGEGSKGGHVYVCVMNTNKFFIKGLCQVFRWSFHHHCIYTDMLGTSCNTEEEVTLALVLPLVLEPVL